MILHRRHVVTALALAVAVTMGASVANGFVYDDVSAIVQNARVTLPHWASIPVSTYWLGTLWRPFTVAGFAAQWAVFGGHAWGFHLISLFAYLAVAILLFVLLERLGASRTLAAMLCLLFVIHPVHVEVVANVVGQSELWVAIALLAATLIYLRTPPTQWHPFYVAALLTTVALGIMAKEQGFVVALLLLGIVWLRLPSGKPGSRAQIRLLWLVAALSLVMFMIRSNVTWSFSGETPAVAFTGAGLGARALTLLDVIPRDAMLLLWPMHLQADYNPPQIPIGGSIGAIHVIGAALVVAIVMLFWWSRRRAPVVAFGCWWTAVTLAPVTNLVTATGVVMAERVLFLPSIGVAIAIAGGVIAWQPRPVPLVVRRSCLAVAAVWLVLMAVRSARRLAVWHDNAAFFTRITADAPMSYRAWQVAGTYWGSVHQTERAEAAFRRAILLWPADADAYEQLGQLLRVEGRCDDAVPVLTAGVRVDPERTPLRAKLVECLITLRRWSVADDVAEAGVQLGQPGFAMDEQRIAKLRSAP